MKKLSVVEAIERAGGPDRVSAAIGKHRTAVYRWLWANELPGARKLDRARKALADVAGVRPDDIVTHQPESTD